MDSHDLAIELGLYMAAARPAFGWPDGNCTHFAAGWVDAVEGNDLLAWLPRPANEMAARREVVHHGGWVTAVTRALAREPMAPALARLGDVVLLRLGGGRHALGICAGRTTAFVDLHGSCVHLPTLDGVAAWRLRVDA